MMRYRFQIGCAHLTYKSSAHHFRSDHIRSADKSLLPLIPIFLNVQSRVDRINDKYGDGHAVVYFEERKEKDMRLAQRLAFFAASDVLMITPTRSLSL